MFYSLLSREAEILPPSAGPLYFIDIGCANAHFVGDEGRDYLHGFRAACPPVRTLSAAAAVAAAVPASAADYGIHSLHRTWLTSRMLRCGNSPLPLHLIELTALPASPAS